MIPRRKRPRHRAAPEKRNPAAGATATGDAGKSASREAQSKVYHHRLGRAIAFYTIDANLVVQVIAFAGVRS